MDTASVMSDDDYDVISNLSASASQAGLRSLDSSLADLKEQQQQGKSEPPPTQAAKQQFFTASLSAEEIQAYVRQALARSTSATGSQVDAYYAPGAKPVRIYVDGAFDTFNTAHALQLRQAKLAFPCVYLLVGLFPDDPLGLNGTPMQNSIIERCEVVRHCRWVDEVIEDAPVVIDKGFLELRGIDYVAVDEGTSCDPTCTKARLYGYDELKREGKVIPTRRTAGLLTPLLNVPVAHNGAAISTSHSREQTELATTNDANGSSPDISPFIRSPIAEEHMDTFGIGI